MLTLDERIAANRRRTAVLVGVIAVVLLPVGLLLGEYLTFLAGLAFISTAADAADGSLLPVAAVVGASLTLLLTWVQYRTARAVVLQALRGVPAHPRRHAAAVESLQGVALGVGLQAPPLRVVDHPAPNCWAVGLQPETAVVVVTQGLVDLLTRDELEVVLAHELIHVRNGDMRLHTLLGAADRMATLVPRILTRLVRALFAVHPLLGAGCLAYVGLAALGLVSAVGLVVLDTPGPGLAVAAVTALPLFALVGAPLIVRVARGLIAANVEAQADAEAWRLTLTPQALATALAKTANATPARDHPPIPVGAFVGRSQALTARLAAIREANPTLSERQLSRAAAAGDHHRVRHRAGRVAAAEPAPVTTARVWAPRASARLRADAWLSDAPTTDAFRYTARLRAGTAVRIVRETDGFLAVETPEGLRGFVPGAALEPERGARP